MSAPTHTAIASALDDAYRACAHLVDLGCRVQSIVIDPVARQRTKVRIARPPQSARLGHATQRVTARTVTYATLVAECQVEWEVSR